jgi:hypothetical protein
VKRGSAEVVAVLQGLRRVSARQGGRVRSLVFLSILRGILLIVIRNGDN